MSPTDHAAQLAPDTAATTRPGVSLRGVNKHFGDFHAVHDLNLDVAPGEFFAMLGPSGSGKTTVLRMIAGFEATSSGTITLEGTDVTTSAPFDRNVNTVFQDYALFPHLTIAENVAYGLRVRRSGKSERSEKVRRALEQVRLHHVADRLPHQLSGGQRQRIALARSLVLEPRVLLLDEPLGALDKQLREHMQIELKQIQREIGITFIFVTHDQEEALTLADRVAVFNEGRIEQIGTPHDVYENPQTRFVAGFLGISTILPPEVAEPLTGISAAISVRPERVRVHPGDHAALPGEIALRGHIAETVYTGASTRYLVDTAEGVRFIASRQNDQHPSGATAFHRGDAVTVVFTREHCAVLPR